MIKIGDTKIGSISVGAAKIGTGLIGEDKVFASVKLPVGYTELPYVSSVYQGGYVDTGIAPSDTLGVKTSFKRQAVNSVDVSLLGTRENSGDTRYVLSLYNGTAGFSWQTFVSAAQRVTVAADTWYQAVCNWKNSRKWSINNVTRSVSGTQIQFTKTIQLFGSNRATGYGTAIECSLGRTAFTLGDDVIADMVPCKDPNDVVGFYDVVRKEFFTSANGIDLIAGT